VPKAAVSRCSNTSVQKPDLLDHLVGAREQRRRNFEAERPGGPKIDEEFELGRLFNRQLAGFGSLQELVHINSHATANRIMIDAVRHERTCVQRLPRPAGQRQSIRYRELRDGGSIGERPAVRIDDDPLDLSGLHGCENGVQIFRRAPFNSLSGKSQCGRGRGGRIGINRSELRVGVNEQCNARQSWNDLLEQFQSLADKVTRGVR